MSAAFKKGDLVLVLEYNTQTDILADALGDLDDRSITKRTCELLAEHLADRKPLEIVALEEDGFILGLPGRKKGLTGIILAEELTRHPLP